VPEVVDLSVLKWAMVSLLTVSGGCGGRVDAITDQAADATSDAAAESAPDSDEGRADGASLSRCDSADPWGACDGWARCYGGVCCSGSLVDGRCICGSGAGCDLTHRCCVPAESPVGTPKRCLPETKCQDFRP
jgi:hypothetical protein